MKYRPGLPLPIAAVVSFRDYEKLIVSAQTRATAQHVGNTINCSSVDFDNAFAACSTARLRFIATPNIPIFFVCHVLRRRTLPAIFLYEAI
jgi:hypothetical protein